MKIAYSTVGAAICFLVAALSELPTTPVVALAMGILFGVTISLFAIDAQNEISRKSDESHEQDNLMSMAEDVQDFEALVIERRNRIIK